MLFRKRRDYVLLLQSLIAGSSKWVCLSGKEPLFPSFLPLPQIHEATQDNTKMGLWNVTSCCKGPSMSLQPVGLFYYPSLTLPFVLSPLVPDDIASLIITTSEKHPTTCSRHLQGSQPSPVSRMFFKAENTSTRPIGEPRPRLFPPTPAGCPAPPTWRCPPGCRP